VYFFLVDHPQLTSKIYVENRIQLSSDRFIVCYVSVQLVLGMLLEKNFYVFFEKHRQLKNTGEIIFIYKWSPLIPCFFFCFLFGTLLLLFLAF